LHIPVNSSAVLHLPAVINVTEGGQSVRKAQGVAKISVSNENMKFRLESGSYHFRFNIES